MEEQIAVGDAVRFKGGGSFMTIEKIEGDEAICVFSLGGKQRLKLDVLEKVPDEPHWWDRGYEGRVAVTGATYSRASWHHRGSTTGSPRLLLIE